MSPMSLTGPDARIRFPRVSGDEPLMLALMMLVIGFSPRERG